MGVSETIIAAMIGACATVTTAVFQLLRARGASDVRPRRSRIRSYLSIAMLMVASAAAGFLYAELRGMATRDEIAALRVDLLQREALQRSTGSMSPAVAGAAGRIDSVEAIAHLPPCVVADPAALATLCDDATVQRVTLCVGVPAGASVRRAEVQARGVAVGEDWVPLSAAPASAAPVRLAGDGFSYDSGADGRALCQVVGNWTPTQTQVARLVIELDHGETI